MSEPKWIYKDIVHEIHEMVVAGFGGSQGVRDEGLLDSALSNPRNIFAYENASIFDLAASYVESIVNNHPFIDGNKRTAFTTADVFLDFNGYRLNADKVKQADIVVDLTEKKISRGVLAKFLQENSQVIIID